MSLRDLYEDYSSQIQFMVVYIREAHPEDGWNMRPNGIYDPKTIEERRELAGTCKETMKYGIQTLVDKMDDDVMTTYSAWPERLYLVGIDGRVIYPGARGPWGFKPEELKASIDTLFEEKVVS